MPVQAYASPVLPLNVRRQCVERDVRRSDGDTKYWRPLVFLMTDGTPSDALAYGEAGQAIRGRGLYLSLPAPLVLKQAMST